MSNRIDHRLLDKFLGYVLDKYKSGDVSQSSAIGTIAHLVGALDLPPESEPDNPTDYMNAVLNGAMED